MSDHTRRKFLHVATASSTGALAGCGALSSSTPPGTLAVRNDHDLPHLVSVAVVDGPETAVAVENRRGGTFALEAGQQRTTEEFLTGADAFRLEVQVDDGQPEQFVFRPRRPERDPGGRVLDLVVDEDGVLDWSISPVE